MSAQLEGLCQHVPASGQTLDCMAADARFSTRSFQISGTRRKQSPLPSAAAILHFRALHQMTQKSGRLEWMIALTPSRPAKSGEASIQQKDTSTAHKEDPRTQERLRASPLSCVLELWLSSSAFYDHEIVLKGSRTRD
jgi:hypothetical protein